MALVAADQEGYVTNNRLQQLLDTHSINSSKILASLIDRGYLESDGVGRGTKYYLTDIFKNENIKINNDLEDKCDDLDFDEKRVLEYILKNEYITTKLCTEILGVGKTKSKKIFNRLIDLGKIKRVGTGSKINYVISNNK